MNQNEKPTISVVIPVFNEERYLGECLSSLTEIDYPKNKYEIIIVDNGSTDKSIEVAKSFPTKIISAPDINVGAVRNIGAKHARGEILAFLDSDCIAPKNWLRNGETLVKENPNHAFGGTCLLREKPVWIEKYWLIQNPELETGYRDLLGSSIILDKAYFTSVDGFNEDMTSGEDSNLSDKLREKGVTIKITNLLAVIHLGNPTTINEFINRQVWHSENYFLDTGKTLKDKIFWISCLYLASYFILLIGIASNAFNTAALGLLSISLCAAILSVKRIYRSGYKSRKIKDLTCIFLIDNFYLIGRSAGIIKSLCKNLFTELKV